MNWNGSENILGRMMTQLCLNKMNAAAAKSRGDKYVGGSSVMAIVTFFSVLVAFNTFSCKVVIL